MAWRGGGSGGGGGGHTTTPINITAADFTGPNNDTYTNATLIGKVAGTDFDVWTNEGGGTLLSEGSGPTDGYVFVSGTGVFTMPAGKYKILYYTA